MPGFDGAGVTNVELKPGDNVLTTAGEHGRVVHTSRLTVFVAFTTQGEADTIKGYLESQLTKVEPPHTLDPERR